MIINKLRVSYISSLAPKRVWRVPLENLEIVDAESHGLLRRGEDYIEIKCKGDIASDSVYTIIIGYQDVFPLVRYFLNDMRNIQDTDNGWFDSLFNQYKDELFKMRSTIDQISCKGS